MFVRVLSTILFLKENINLLSSNPTEWLNTLE